MPTPPPSRPSRPPSPPPGDGRRGVTLVELLIVLSLVAIAAGLVLPRYDVTPLRADAGVRLLHGALQQAQRMAVQHQHDMIVSIDVAGRRIRLAEDSTNDRIADAGERQRWLPLDQGVAFVVPPAPAPGSGAGGAVSGTRVLTVDGMPSIVFHRNGAASSDLAVYLAAERRGRPGPGELRAVTVLRSTGRTERFRWLGGAWVEGAP